MTSLALGIGGHHSARATTNEWLTPPALLRALGHFDLDPCAPVARPWPTAERHFTIEDNGLNLPWRGRVWCNPPYNSVARWLARCAAHGNAIALIFARTETQHFFDSIWGKASAVYFLRGRINFHFGSGLRATANAGAPSCLVAWDEINRSALLRLSLGTEFPGRLVDA